MRHGFVWQHQLLLTAFSYLFSCGVRSRENKYEFASGASIVYPKYKTAIYIRECFFHGHRSIRASLCANNRRLVEDVSAKLEMEETSQYDLLTENGWNALVLSQYDLDEDRKQQTFQWLEARIKENVDSRAERGKVLICG